MVVCVLIVWGLVVLAGCFDCGWFALIVVGRLVWCLVCGDGVVCICVCS